MLVFEEKGNTGVPGEKPLGAKERTNNQLDPNMASTPEFEPGPHWFEASALTTAKAIGLLSKTITLLVHNTFLYILCRHCTTTTWKWPFSRFMEDVSKRRRIFRRACLHGGGGPGQIGEVTCGGSPHPACKHDQIKMRDYMDRRVTWPTWGRPPLCIQAFTLRVLN